MIFVFLAHLFSTLFMTGVIWFAQVVHYPLLGRVGKGALSNMKRRTHGGQAGWSSR